MRPSFAVAVAAVVLLAGPVFAEPPVLAACDVAQNSSVYQGATFTIETDLVIDMRHTSLMNVESACRPAIRFTAEPGSQPAAALREIEDVMLGTLHLRKYGRRAPMTFLDLWGTRVRATGTMVCKPDDGCSMRLSRLDQVVYPAKVPKEMLP